MLKAITGYRLRNLGHRHFSTLKGRVLIETGELDELMAKSPDKLSILNAALERGGFEQKPDHIKERIPGSIFFDLALISDQLNPAPLMLPPLDQFIYYMKDMDVRKSDFIVCYDKQGMLSAPRAYWMFKVFGAENVYILNGTFEKWKIEQRKVASGDNE